MSSLPQRVLQALAAVFSVRVVLAFTSASVVTAGVAGPLALQALDARANQAAAAATEQPQADGSSSAPGADNADDPSVADPQADDPSADDPPADDPPEDDPPADDPPADDPSADAPSPDDEPTPTLATSPRGGVAGVPTASPGGGDAAPAPSPQATDGDTGGGGAEPATTGSGGGTSTSGSTGTGGTTSGTNSGSTGSGTSGTGGTTTGSSGTTTSSPVPAQPIIVVSLNPSLSPAYYLEGSLVWDEIHLAVRPPQGTTSVRFWLDRPTTGSPDRTDTSAPFTLTPGSTSLDAESLTEGAHTLRIIANVPGRGEVAASATFRVRHTGGE